MVTFLSNAIVGTSNSVNKSAENLYGDQTGTLFYYFSVRTADRYLVYGWSLTKIRNEKWKSQIDKNIANNDWYIKHGNTFENQQKVIFKKKQRNLSQSEER